MCDYQNLPVLSYTTWGILITDKTFPESKKERRSVRERERRERWENATVQYFQTFKNEKTSKQTNKYQNKILPVLFFFCSNKKLSHASFLFLSCRCKICSYLYMSTSLMLYAIVKLCIYIIESGKKKSPLTRKFGLLSRFKGV